MAKFDGRAPFAGRVERALDGVMEKVHRRLLEAIGVSNMHVDLLHAGKRGVAEDKLTKTLKSPPPALGF